MGKGSKSINKRTDARSPLQVNRPQKSLPGQPSPQCVEPPPFTISDVRNYIKERSGGVDYFTPNLCLSFAYLARDLVFFAILLALGLHIHELPAWAQFVVWPTYWYAQGSVMTGLWVIAHECGHRAFAKQDWINYLVGHILHTLLLVPFHPWRISHANHHSNTNCMENDEVFVPSTYDAQQELAEQRKKDDEAAEHSAREQWRHSSHRVEEAFAASPLGALLDAVKIALVGWPAYITINAAGPEKYVGKNNTHFAERSVLFTKGERPFVRESLIWFAVVATGLVLLTVFTGADVMAAHYFVPYLVVNSHLTLITYLQHTDTFVPHWHVGEFTFLRGALATVDRSWGVVQDFLFHHIADSHVVHHLFSDMPFYYATKSTEILEGWEEFQRYRLKDDTPILLAIYRSAARCRVVPAGGTVCWYEDGRQSCLDPAVVEGGKGKVGSSAGEESKQGEQSELAAAE